MTLADATRYAEEFRAAIAPFCVPGQCVVAGSVRRKCPNPSDVEIVAVPITNDFDMLDGLRTLLKSGRFGTMTKGGFPARYTCVKGPHCQFDLFWCSRETFGLNLFIRTGSESFSRDGLGHWKKITND